MYTPPTLFSKLLPSTRATTDIRLLHRMVSHQNPQIRKTAALLSEIGALQSVGGVVSSTMSSHSNNTTILRAQHPQTPNPSSRNTGINMIAKGVSITPSSRCASNTSKAKRGPNSSTTTAAATMQYPPMSVCQRDRRAIQRHSQQKLLKIDKKVGTQIMKPFSTNSGIITSYHVQSSFPSSFITKKNEENQEKHAQKRRYNTIQPLIISSNELLHHQRKNHQIKSKNK